MSRLNVNLDGNWALKHGIIGGIIAGIVFAVADMTAAWLTPDVNNPIMPLKMAAGVLLQRQPALIDDATGIVVGVLAHMLYSVVLSVLVAYTVQSVPALRNSQMATVLFGTIVGFMMWPLSYYVIGPAINAPWFRDATDPLQHFIWNTFAYGTVLGLYLASRLPGTITATQRAG